jgi:NADH:ubiquinone oxidoreductase subunit F (NADH-binding)
MTQPRLLAGLTGTGSLSLAQHRAVHGDVPRLDPAGQPSFLSELNASGLRGRGGAGFPAGIKAAAVAGRRRPTVIVNGSESEPMSYKDEVLLTRTPHLVIDGALLAAQAVGASEVLVAAAPDVLAVLGAALDEREQPERQAPEVRLCAKAPGYVAGEETALLAHLEGRPPLPRVKPPLPVERGLRGRPTLMYNAETVAQLALIARHGASWFRSEGTLDHPGTTLVTASGAVRAPGVYEVPLGTPLPQLVELAGGTVEPVRAMLIGGYFGAWIAETGHGVTLDEGALRQAGGGIGAGVVVALGISACPVAETARLAAWMCTESAGQCGPCVHGLASIADLVQRIADGRAEAGDRGRLTRWASMIQGRGACRHPDGVARMIASAASVFSHEFADHVRYGPCENCERPATLITPRREARAA